MPLSKILSNLKPFNKDITWTLPTDLKHGILTTNFAFVKAKKEGINPVELANQIKQELEDFIQKNNISLSVKTVGPYINLDYLAKAYDEILNTDIELDQILEKEDKNVLVEFCSVNVAKPLHAGHVRNINFGESIRRILKTKYTNVKTDNYWGDWGVQFGIIIWAFKIFQKKKLLTVSFQGEESIIKLEEYNNKPIDILVKLYIWGNAQKEKVENWEKLVRDEFLKLEKGDKENRKLWQNFLDLTKETIYPELEKFGVEKHDYGFGESYYEDRMKVVSKFLEENNIWQKDGLARYFDFEELVENTTNLDPELAKKIKKLGRCYLISSKGYSSYAFRDVAARIHWTGELDMDLMITITGNEQSHHFNQFFAICYYLSTLKVFRDKFGEKVANRFNYDSLKHLSHGFLTLPEGKMSTRKGNFLTAQDVLNKVNQKTAEVLEQKGGNYSKDTIKKTAIAAIKWFDLNRDSKLDLVLDMDQILNFVGNTGIYQLYTIARLSSILEKNDIAKDFENDINLLNEEEKFILKRISTLPIVLEESTRKFKPHLICNYLFEIATDINSWYSKYSVNNEKDDSRKDTLLRFCELLKNHNWKCLELLGITPVESL
jgi:arginyl-tRNA synthetase